MKSVNSLSGNGLGRRISALIGVTALSVASSVSLAAIVDSGTVNIAVPDNVDGVYLNVVTGATGTTGATVVGWDLNPYNNGSGFAFFLPSTPAGSGGCVVTAAATPCLALADGTTVGPANVFQAGVAAGTNFRAAGTRTVGFRFQNEATGVVNYGYANITNSAGAGTSLGFPATIVRYVYENAGIAIVVAPAGPPPGADLVLTQSNNAAGNALLIGNTFQKTLTVTNNGPSAATGITVTDTLPAQLTFVSSTCGATAAGQVVTYTIATLASAAVNNCVLTLRITAPGTIVNTAAITASAPTDPNLVNNTTTAQIGAPGGGVAQTAVPALDRNMVLVLLGLVSVLGMLALRQRQG